MNLQYLKSFFVTVKLNSISKAAKVLHLTQPGLSVQIQSLEKELGITLLNRSNKGVELTEAGKIVFDYASTILSLQENIDRDLENLKVNRKNLLIGSCKAIGEYALPCSIYVFKQDHKDIEINMEISNTKEVIENLINRNINIGIIHGDIHEKNIETIKITKDRLLLVTSLPLMKDSISLDELTKLPLIFREQGSGVRDTVIKYIDPLLPIDKLNVIYELNSMEAIKSSVISGKGISFIPELSIKRELKEGILKEIKIENLDLICEFYIAYRKDYCLTPFESDFINFIKSSRRGFC
ncbi:DNA-binding transcriptional regulator, LysR family [Alkalithermobacter thermoalcaliphilus JW-YL-7 = DSM 7308]|uniref:Transcriptional regulator, LysR family n=1 Tax=Alkalithermobacter thermoalcaliphilus JW-YL-7 = DSM 7308 TaxID=1121328 RepID=A0A150FQN5_CLOPD|nr:transcriptional regulator, LysR family [[Clostridium] paradoxum JW-YL-7 = DSM 7308]SHK77136.1 DNA-binding transcriptional regulator, LysR family [[Clostridium] paradoxum JW-YL-7 = DSM 7308]